MSFYKVFAIFLNKENILFVLFVGLLGLLFGIFLAHVFSYLQQRPISIPLLIIFSLFGIVFYWSIWIGCSIIFCNIASCDLSQFLQLDAFSYLPTLLLIRQIFIHSKLFAMATVHALLQTAIILLATVIPILTVKLYFYLRRQEIRKLELTCFTVILISIIVSAFSLNFTKTGFEAGRHLLYIARHFNASYDDKMRAKWPVFYDFMMFVRSQTSEDAIIAIPPPDVSLFYFGDDGPVLNYFLYPRRIIQISGSEDLAPTEITHVLIIPANQIENHQAWPPLLPTGSKIKMNNGFGLAKIKSILRN